MAHDSLRMLRARTLRPLRAGWVAAALLASVGVPAGPAGAIPIPRPEPPRRLTVQGTVIGRVATGREVRFLVVATDPQSFLHLRTLRIAMVVRGHVLQDITFDVAGGTIAVTGQEPAPIGVPGTLTSSFFQILTQRVRQIRSTFSIRLSVRARILEDVPRDTEFHFIATDQDGRVSFVRRRAPLAPALLSWGTLALAVAIALFAGTFAGNNLSSRRYRRREPSVWDIVERRLKEQRVRPPAPRPAPAGEGAG